MTKSKLLIAVFIGTSIGLAVANQIITNRWIVTAQQLEIQQACDQSRNMISGNAETYCGRLQDHYNIEYLCNSYRADAYCWTEVKDN